jgi:hypothetical protein
MEVRPTLPHWKPEGAVLFHHLIPGVWVMEVRRLAHQWIVFHETYTFCLPSWMEVPSSIVDWRYRRRLFAAMIGNTMVMEPGELHANLRRTPVADFVVAQVQPSVMLETAAELGWPHAQLHIKLPQHESREPGLIQALRQIEQSLCTRDAGRQRPNRRFVCTCLASGEEHRENLHDLVQAVIDVCAERANGPRAPEPASAPTRRAEGFLRENYRSRYSLTQLCEAAGCESPSTPFSGGRFLTS